MILYSNSRQCSLEILIIYYMWKYYTLHKDLVKMMYFSSEHQKKKTLSLSRGISSKFMINHLGFKGYRIMGVKTSLVDKSKLKLSIVTQ